jgi:hypothetical protein
LVDDGIIVDANFSALWTEPRDNRVAYAVLALMNSSWIQACLESTATVMGGGALKAEASHLRALPFPAPTEKLISSLYALGEQLAQVDTKCSDGILLQIDKTVISDGFGIVDPMQHCERLRSSVTAKGAIRKR